MVSIVIRCCKSLGWSYRSSYCCCMAAFVLFICSFLLFRYSWHDAWYSHNNLTIVLSLSYRTYRSLHIAGHVLILACRNGPLYGVLYFSSLSGLYLLWTWSWTWFNLFFILLISIDRYFFLSIWTDSVSGSCSKIHESECGHLWYRSYSLPLIHYSIWIGFAPVCQCRSLSHL